MSAGEFGRQCGLCRKRRESRRYYKKIKGRWLKICPECWSKLEQKRQEKDANDYAKTHDP
jgi:ribosome-binding protein aMBF1 (putative translation factor)